LDRTVFENVLLPLEVAGASAEEAVKIVESALGLVGLTEHKDKFPIQLSGGEVQRVAIARALVLSPEILLADEPTGNLDAATSWEIVKLLSDINKRGTTVVMATHNRDVIKSLGKRIIHIEKGKIVDEEKAKKVSEKHHENKDEKGKLSEAKSSSAEEEKE
jgi:cell division transport system ATP-binding protein